MVVKLTPKGEARRNRILDIATRMFIERGYDGMSLQQIVGESGGSLATIYRLFGDKRGLFRAIVRRRAAAFFTDLDSTHAFTLPIEPALTAIARMLMSFLLAPDTIAIHRELIGNGRHFPSLRHMMFNKRATFIARLAAYLRQQARAGVIVVPDAVLAARQFMVLAWIDVPEEIMSGERTIVSASRRHRLCEAAVATFLRGVLPSAGASRGKRRSPRSARRRGSAQPRA